MSNKGRSGVDDTDDAYRLPRRRAGERGDAECAGGWPTRWKPLLTTSEPKTLIVGLTRRGRPGELQKMALPCIYEY